MKKMFNTTYQSKIWSSKFGKEYTDRNLIPLSDLEKLYKNNYGITRTKLNEIFLNKISRSIRILEVGSNVGNQLLYLQEMGFKNLWGIEPQGYAVELSKNRARYINIIKGNCFYIPFKDKSFDLVYTSGVLIHISPRNIKKAMKEIYRCACKYIWGFEYYSGEYEEIEYRGEKNLLWKANFPKIYTDIFPNLRIEKIKFLKYSENKNIDVMFLLKKIK